MPSIRNSYHSQDRDTAVNARGIADAVRRGELPSLSTYFEARNFRPYSSEALTKNALNNVKGTELKSDIGATFKYWYNGAWHNGTGTMQYQVLIGVGDMRGKTVFISTNNKGSTPDDPHESIWVVDLNETSPVIYRVWYGSGLLELSTKNPIYDNIVCRYESNELQKIYFADGNNNLRWCNVAMTTENLNANLTRYASEFDMLNSVTFSKPYLDSMATGRLKTGVVQYAYRLYKLKGPETKFSPASEFVHLTDKSESAANTSLYKGQSELDKSGSQNISGKGCNIQIDNIDTSYDRIEVVAIHYTSIINDPEISIVGRFNVTSTLNFLDDGSYNQGTYSLNEFRTLGGLLFSPKTIASKDNKLFAGNVTINYWDVDFDARAYRWAADGYCRMSDVNDYTSYYRNFSDAGGWIKFPSGPHPSSWDDIPTDFDCLNRFNDVINDGTASNQYMYQKTNANNALRILGGEGPNIKYRFGTKSMTADDQTSFKTMQVGQDTDDDNPSFYNYASPFKATKISYRRDETYRVAIVFQNSKGQESYPKWIGDIRFPRGSETEDGITNKYRFFHRDGPAKAKPMYLEVYVKNMPEGATGWRIVRVERQEKDKTVIAGGVLGAWRSSLGSPYIFYSISGIRYQNLALSMLESKLFQFMSPEINFYKNLTIGSEDYLEPFARCSSSNQDINYFDPSLPGRWTSPIAKMYDWLPISAEYRQKVTEGEVFSPPEDSNEITDLVEKTYYKLGGEQFRMLVNQIYRVGWTEYHKHQNTARGTCFIGKVQNAMSINNVDSSDYIYANYKRRTSQYGGFDYNAKQNNIYIPCSEIFSSTDVNTYKEIWGGDTFITYFDYLYSQPSKNIEGSSVALVGYSSFLVFPCETSINLNLRHDDCFHRVKASFSSSYIRERDNTDCRHGSLGTNNEWTYANDPAFIDWSDMYLYNSAYSKLNNSKIYVSKPMDFIEDEVRDTLVLASREKTNLEERDSWLRWDTDERKEVDSQYGSLVKLTTYKNHLIFFQHDGIGTLSVNERALLQDVTQAALELGTGKVLDRYDMLTFNSGIQNQAHMVKSPNGFYWTDTKRKEFNRYSSKLMNISKVKGADSWFQEITDAIKLEPTDFNYNAMTGIVMGYDPTFKEIIIEKITFNSVGEAIIFNEIKDEFTSIFDYNRAQMFFNVGHRLCSTGLNSKIYENNVGIYSHFYNLYKNPEIIYIINPQNETVCVFNNFEFAMEMYDSSGNNLVDGIPSFIRMQNDYQDTTYQVLSLGDNIKRRMRTWRFRDFRDSGNARMRDTYLKLSMKFINAADERIVLHPLTSHYMIPAESLVR